MKAYIENQMKTSWQSIYKKHINGSQYMMAMVEQLAHNS